MIRILEIVEISIISIITEFIIINTIIQNDHKKKQLNKMQTYIVVVIIGIIVYITSEYFEISKWYTEKRYLTGVKMLAS